MSLRWTAYVAPKPPKGASKATILSFPYKKLIDFAGRKSAAKFVCVKTVSGKVVRPIRLCRMVGGRCQNDPPWPASKTAIFTRYSPVATVLWQNEIIVCKCADYWSNLRFRQRGTSLWHTRSGWTPKLRTMKFSMKKLETLLYRTVFIHLQIISSFCHNPRIWQTDRQTDGRTDVRTDVDSNYQDRA